MSEDKIIAVDDAILEERAKLLAELSDLTKAANIIESLREENARLNEKTNDGESDDCKSFGCLFESWKTHYQKLTTQNAAMREENERLREEVERLKTSVGGIMNARDQTENRLREENERLRKALKPFAAPVKDFRHSVPDRFVVEEEFTLGQLRAAAAAIREGGKDG